MTRRAERRAALSSALVEARERDWVVAVAASLITIAALVVGSTGSLHGSHLRPKVTAGVSAFVLVVFGVVATRRLAAVLGHVIRVRTIPPAGAAARLLATVIGYVFVFFATLGLLNVSIEHLLVGAGLAGVVLGIAAQQSLGNVFAGFVLLLARPFVVGEHIRIRSGALGGIFDGTVLAISLTYVTIRVEDGVLKLPNSALLAAGVGPFPKPSATKDGDGPGQVELPPGTPDAGPGRPA